MSAVNPADQPSRPPRDLAGGWLTIDLSALAANWRRLRDEARGAECASVVKADAYGIGLEPAIGALRMAGCRTFFVAHPIEGTRARAVAPDATIYVLNGLLPGKAAAYHAAGLRPVLGSLDEAAEWAAFCRAAGARLPAAIHADTGMNRLGLAPEEGRALASSADLAAFTPTLLMSHLVAAEDPAHPMNRRQIEAFAALRQAFPGVPGSLANSSGIFLGPAAHHDLVRPGYALYGGNPVPGRANPMSPVVALQARIVQVRRIEAGESAGYGGAWTAPSTRNLATLSTGYADGMPRAAWSEHRDRDASRSTGVAIVAGVRCPFVGRISMDLLIIDVTALPAGAVRRGDPVMLIGGDLTLDEVGTRAGTIGYEILTGLGRRYGRTYIGGAGHASAEY